MKEALPAYSEAIGEIFIVFVRDHIWKRITCAIQLRSHTSKLVKRGGHLQRYREVSGEFYLQVSEGKSISSKVQLVDVCRCHLH